MAPKIISWIASFFFISVMWVQHHNLFRMAAKIDYGMVWLNNIFLLLISFLPFPTALMGEYPHNRPAVLLFGLVVTLASLMQVWMYFYVAKYHLLSHYDQQNVIHNCEALVYPGANVIDCSFCRFVYQFGAALFYLPDSAFLFSAAF